MPRGKNPRHAQNPLSGELKKTLSITHHALSPPPSHHHLYIIHLISWLQGFYPLTMSQRPFVPKSDVNDLLLLLLEVVLGREGLCQRVPRIKSFHNVDLHVLHGSAAFDLAPQGQLSAGGCDHVLFLDSADQILSESTLPNRLDPGKGCTFHVGPQQWRVPPHFAWPLQLWSNRRWQPGCPVVSL